MRGDAALRNQPAASQEQYSTVPLRLALMMGKTAYCSGTGIQLLGPFLNLIGSRKSKPDHAAGFVVLRLAMKNASPNMKSVNSTSVANDDSKLN